MKRMLLTLIGGMVLLTVPSFGQIAPLEHPPVPLPGNPAYNVASSTVDSKGNTYVTGFFTDSLLIGNQTLISRGSVDIFLAKFKPDNTIEWIRHAGGSSLDLTQYIQADTLDNIYVSGIFKGRLELEDTSLYSKGLLRYFTAKYTDNGNLLWIRQNYMEK